MKPHRNQDKHAREMTALAPRQRGAIQRIRSVSEEGTSECNQVAGSPTQGSKEPQGSFLKVHDNSVAH